MSDYHKGSQVCTGAHYYAKEMPASYYVCIASCILSVFTQAKPIDIETVIEPSNSINHNYDNGCLCGEICFTDLRSGLKAGIYSTVIIGTSNWP